MEWFDTHAHLDDESFGDCRDAVLRRAAEAGVRTVLAVGTTAASSHRCLELVGRRSFDQPGLSGCAVEVVAAVGIQPNYVAEAAPEDWDEVERLARSGRAVALGETGLDKYWDHSPLELQRDYFDRHLRLSQELDLPFIVHLRESGDEILEMLVEARRRGPLRGVMHSFTGDELLARACLELGLHLSFAGMLTFKKNDALRQVAAATPADRLLVETDSPYLAPEPHRGRRPNEPAWVVHTGERLALDRGLTSRELAALTTANARTLFRV